MRKIMLTAALAGALLITAPAAALAVGSVNEPAAVQSGDPYTPDEPQTPTLAGSTAVGECVKDVPWISYSVALTDPDHQSTGNFARLVLTDGTNSHTIDLGTLVDGKLSGSVLWPGASTDGAGNATGWPGWEFVGGEWKTTTDNFAWTRGAISARIEVNPSVSVPLAYPPATPVCATAPVLMSELPLSDNLPATGLSATVFVIAAAGGAVLLVGLTFLIVQRRRSRV